MLTTPDESVVVKGSPVRSFQKFIDGEFTPAQRDEVFRNIPPEYAARLRTTVLPTETIPVWILNRITEDAARVKGEDVEKFARRVGRQGASDAFAGVYRFFALVLTPTALLSKASQMWSTLYNRGQLKVENQTSNSAVIRLVDYPTERVNCQRLTGWIERIAELTGVKNIRIVQTRCFAQGGEDCRWEVNWQ